MKKLGLETGAGAIEFELKDGAAIATEGFRSVYTASRGNWRICELGKNAAGEPLVVKFRSGELALFAGDEKVRELLPSAMLGMKPDADASEPLRVPFSVGGREFCLVVFRAKVATKDGAPRLQQADYLILEK